MAVIQFVQGIDEGTVADVRLTRSKSKQDGTAMLRFEGADALADDFTEEITGMYMIDEEGTITTRDVNVKFINGKASAIEATYVMRSPEEWDRFIRFMDRYAEKNGLVQQKKS